MRNGPGTAARAAGARRTRTPRGGRRRPGGVLAALLALLLAPACDAAPDSGSGGAAAGSGSGASHAADTGGDIVLASGVDVTGRGGIRRQLVEDWNKKQAAAGTRWRARIVDLPGSADQQRSQLLGALQSGSAEYDVVNLDVTWVPEFAAADLVRELPGDLVDDQDVIPSVAATAKWGDQVYAVPFNSDVGLLYYRRDYLKSAGVTDPELGKDTHWSVVQQLTEALGAADRKPAQAYEKGWTAQLDASYEGLTVNGIEAFASAVDGLRLTDGAGRYSGTPKMLEAGVDELRNRTQAAYTLPDSARSDEADSLNDFARGRTAFLRHWPYAYGALHQSLTPEQLGVAPLPGRAVLGGQNLAVTTASKRANAAVELVRYLTDAGSERCLLNAGFAATRRSAYDHDGLECKLLKGSGAPSAPASKESTDRMPRDGQGRPEYAHGTLLPALQKAVQRPRTPLYGAFTQTFAAELGRLQSAKPPSKSELAADLHAKLRQALP
ncbi:ABC transporter substrate-binding protein [Streptomyces globosus]|uniref:ABC transporter substrate-binding protein n=1 Tax=Streptomyces globosus TaxID=68209 RepID=A0A344U0I4_9ACTN|nr:extracellular solute-binding protein [Streptomyces globosus]AXE24405.1 ABC transporter substrate-binding protein [Streptomyces globosus]